MYESLSVMSYMNESCHIWMSHDTYKLVMSCMSHDTHSSACTPNREHTLQHTLQHTKQHTLQHTLQHTHARLLPTRAQVLAHPTEILSCRTWLIHMWHDLSSHMHFTCDMTYAFIHDMTSSYVSWLIYTWRDSFIYDMTHALICDMTHSSVTCLIHMWHDFFMCYMMNAYATISHVTCEWVVSYRGEYICDDNMWHDMWTSRLHVLYGECNTHMHTKHTHTHVGLRCLAAHCKRHGVLYGEYICDDKSCHMWMSRVTYEHMANAYATCLIHPYITWLIHMWQFPFIWDVTHSSVTWLAQVRHDPFIHTWHDSLRKTWRD